MRIEHDDDAPKGKLEVGGQVSSSIHYQGHRASFVVSQDGTRIVVSPEEAQIVVEGLGRELMKLEAAGGDAVEYGNQMWGKR